jgi:hypothetical protein
VVQPVDRYVGLLNQHHSRHFFDPMIFTEDQISGLAAALPDYTDPRRRAALPLVLGEWGCTELEEHLTRSTPIRIRVERKQMEAAAAHARQLVKALSALGPNELYVIAAHLAAPGLPEPLYAPRPEVLTARHGLDDLQARLEALAAAAEATAASWTPLPRRHSTLVRYLVLQDLAAIFEWATGQRAGRRIKTDIAEEDAGRPYGPFWNFAAAAWPMIFGSTRGLGNSVKEWASARRRYREISPIIYNLHFAHPEWRLLEE